jgi:hypothetical protein
MKVRIDPVIVLSCNVAVGQGYNGHCNLTIDLPL